MTAAGPVKIIGIRVQLPDAPAPTLVRAEVVEQLGVLAITHFAARGGFRDDRYQVSHIPTGVSIDPRPLTLDQAHWLLRTAVFAPDLRWDELYAWPPPAHIASQFAIRLNRLLARMPQ